VALPVQQPIFPNISVDTAENAENNRPAGIQSATASNLSSAPHLPHLSMRVASAIGTPEAASFVAHQYATYPFHLSKNLRLDPIDPRRVYAYIMNASPGILSGDNLQLAVAVGKNASLYLTDQSATKAHSQPPHSAPAQIDYAISVDAGACLEYIPEPIILFKAAALTQRMQVTLHPQGQLVLGEIIVPGRLARGEFYEFDYFRSYLQVQTPDGKRCFADTLQLAGSANRFKHSPFVTDWPILGNFVAIVPDIDLAQLTQHLEAYEMPSEMRPRMMPEMMPGMATTIQADELRVCDSPLPGCNGLLIRALATRTDILKHYQRHLLNGVRRLTGQPPLPQIPK
jgi:urease accessory protein